MRFIAFLLVVALVARFFWWIVGAVLLYVLVSFGAAVWRELRAGTARVAAERAAIIARCDQQHAWVMVGDPRGTYSDEPSKARPPSVSGWWWGGVAAAVYPRGMEALGPLDAALAGFAAEVNEARP